MKKLSLILVTLTTVALIFLTACVQTLEEKKVEFYTDIQTHLQISQIKLILDNATQYYSDNKEISNVVFTFNKTLGDDEATPPLFNGYIATIFNKDICNGHKINSGLNKYTSDGNYINVYITEPNGKNLAYFKIDDNFCKPNKLIQNFLDLLAKQLAQGYYDEEYLPILAIDFKMQKLPLKIDDRITMVNVKAGPASQLHFFLDFNPKNESIPLSEMAIITLGRINLNKFVNYSCNAPGFIELSNNIDLITFHFTKNNIDYATTTIKKGCKIVTAQDEISQLSEEFKEYYPKLPNFLRLNSISPYLDNFGINVKLNLISKQPLIDTIQPQQLDSFFQYVHQSYFCDKKELNSNLNKFTSKGHYINININDYNDRPITEFKIDGNFCRQYEPLQPSEPLSRAYRLLQQDIQGSYDEQFLSNEIIPLLKNEIQGNNATDFLPMNFNQSKSENLPLIYNNDISIVDVKAGPGSQVHYILNYQPREAKTSEEIKEIGSISLYETVNNYCDTAKFNDLSQKVNLITFHFTFNDNDVLTKSIKKGCQILPSTNNPFELVYKQKKQGFYDEKYLSSVIIPREKADLPLDYNNEIRLVNIKPGTGSQLHYILNYKPQNPVTSKEAKELGSNFLYELFGILCGTPKFNELSQNVDLITYHFTLDGKDVLTKSINKGCKIN